MWRPVCVLTLWAGWICALSAAAEEIVVYAKVGDEVVLRPGATFKTGSTITWKEGDNLAMTWDGTVSELFRQFKDRGNLSESTGEMTLRGLIPADSGRYTPEVNEEAGASIHLKVIYPVRRPTVGESCDDEKTFCDLTCDGDTTGAEPFEYAWWSGDTPLNDSSRTRRIRKEDSLSLKELRCELKNPVSQESSEPHPSPFTITPESGVKISTGLTVFISLLAAVLVMVFIHRWKAGTWFFQKESMPWEADFWRKPERPPKDAAGSNGATARQEKGQTDEETPMT